MNKSILRQIPDLARVTKLTAKCNYTSPQGEAINIPEFEVPPDQWNDLVETLAHSTDIDTDDDMTFCGTIQFTTAEGDGIEIWLLKSRRMHYTVLGKAGTTKFVADTEGQEILNLIEKIHAGEEGGSSPK